MAKSSHNTESGAAPQPSMAAASASIPKTKSDRPTLEPPARQASGGAESALGAWNNGQHVVGTFGTANDQNQWLNISGVGWKKIINTSSSANMALTILGNHARLMNTVINYRDEADGMVHEIYAW